MDDETARIQELVARLTHGSERHIQRWTLQLPCPGDQFAVARPLLFVLGLPTFGLAFGISIVTTYGPVVLIHLMHSPSAVGALIGGEGAFALVIPLISGALSDRLRGSPKTRRLPFIAGGAPLVVTGIVLLGFSGTVVAAAVAVVVFFIGYYLFYPPYRALYADLLPRRFYARAQSSQAVLRGAGLGVALLAGGLLLSAWQPLPFMIAAVAVVATTVAIAPIFELENSCPNPVLPYEPRSLRQLVLRNGELRVFAVVNMLWEFSFSGLKSFIVLYIVHGLGRSPAVASAAIAVVAVAYVAGAPLAGRLADRHGIVPVLRVAASIYGVGLVAGVFPRTLAPMLIGLPFVALAGAVLLTLPQALAFSVAPPGTEGAAAGLQDFSRGVGVVLGPIVVGAAIGLFHSEFSATHGYAAMWPVIGIPVLASVFLLRAIEPRGEAAAAEGT